MANTVHSTPYKAKTVKRRLIISVWFIMALLSGALALAVWMFSSVPSFESETETLKKPSVEEVALNIGQITHIDEITQLEDAVHPISFDALVRDLRDYPPEFKDSKYLKANKGQWTVQVMDVSEHEVITDYLMTRDDRTKFAYFRYRDNDNQVRYVLTYGAMKSPQMAMSTAKTTDFKLPANVRILPEEIDRYLDLIENYELSQPMRDLSTHGARQVKLQPATSEIAARRPPKKPAYTSKNINKNEVSQNNTKEANVKVKKPSTDGQASIPKAAEIRESTDTKDTIAINEKRKLVEPKKDQSEKQPTKNSSTTPNKSASVPNEEIAIKPKQPKPPVKPKADPVTPPTVINNDTDSIKALIESKS